MIKASGANAAIQEKLRGAASLISKRDWIVIGWALAIKFLLFLFGAVVYQVLEDKRVHGARGLFELWNHWDAPAYLELARSGFRASGEFKTWFYPLFPWAIRLGAYLTRDYMASALIIAGFGSIGTVLLLRRIVELDFAPGVALRSVWFLLIFPTAYFLHLGYTESLFLSLALGSVLAGRTGRWCLAGLLGGLACMTRANGVVLVPTLGVEIIHQYILDRRWRWQWLWIAIVPLGFGVYLVNNWIVSGDPFAFLHLRKQLFATSVAWPSDGIRQAIGFLSRSPNQAVMIGGQELFFAVLGLVCTIGAWVKLRPLYGMWMTGNWILATSVTFFSGLPRYSLTMFPIFILFALLARNRFWNAVITVWSLLLFAFYASLFVRGWWV